MTKNTLALSVFPPAAAQALRALGENLAIARLRRRESQREWAGRLGCSIPTLIRLERGDPAVGVGLYATALWLIGRASGLSELAEPAEDRGALEDDVREALRRRAVRSAASAQAYLARRRPKQVLG
jgi:transcriptional regulator with XRE-family HTH domain